MEDRLERLQEHLRRIGYHQARIDDLRAKVQAIISDVQMEAGVDIVGALPGGSPDRKTPRSPQGAPRRGRRPRGDVSQEDQMVDLVREHGAPCGPKDVHRLMEERGIATTLPTVRSALSHAHTVGKLIRLSRGKYAADDGVAVERTAITERPIEEAPEEPDERLAQQEAVRQ